MKHTTKQHARTGSRDGGELTNSTAQPKEPKTNEVQVNEVDLTTTDELEEDQYICTNETSSRQTPRSREERKLQKQPSEDTLDNLSKLFDKNILVELTSKYP